MRAQRRRPRLTWLLVPLLIAAVAAATLVATGASTSDKGTPRSSHATARVPAPKAPRRSPDAGPPGIQLIGAKPIRFHFKQPPKAGLLFDVHSGQVLWAYKPLKPRPIASVTKVMSAIIDVERVRPGEMVKITHESRATTGSKVGELPKGKKVQAEALLAGMLLPSGNDAAVALADHVAGRDANFAKLMNQRARQMGLGCTHYVSSYGLQPGNRSCAADLAALARVAISKPRIERLTSREQVHVRFPIKTGRLWLTSTNPLLRMRYPGAIGLKTGSTSQAGECFIGIARRGSRELGVVLLGSPNTGDQAMKLLNAGFRKRP